MAGFVKGDVVVVPFPFSDLTQAKRRPTLVLAVPEGDDLILCQITKRNRLYLAWAALIRRIFEDDPLRCPCGGEMRIVKFLTKPANAPTTLNAMAWRP